MIGPFDRVLAATLPLVPRPVVRHFADRYMAGETLEEAVAAVRRMNDRGVMATIDVLGEFIRAPEEAEATATEYERVLDAIAAERLDANVSVKLSALGVEIDPALADRTLARVLECAERRSDLRADRHGALRPHRPHAATSTAGCERRATTRIGVVLQAYLRRTMDDVHALADARAERPGREGDLRRARGDRLQGPGGDQRELRAHPRRPSVRRKLCRRSRRTTATLIEEVLALLDRRLVSREGYEFQMLLGVTEDVRHRLVGAGHRVRVYVPFGNAWYAYSVRRLRENPSIAGYVARDVVRSFVPGLR